ncbi:MAG: hypothetical protein OXF04_09485 [bacterium]|nr:hypothetical protein [bacterium]
MGDQSCEPDSKIVVGTHEEWLRTKPELTWATDATEFADFKKTLATGIEESECDPTALGLVVTAYTKYLKITDTLVRHGLDDLETVPRTREFTGIDRPAALQASTHGTIIVAYVVLLADQPPAARKPWRKGTWLAKVSFRLETETAKEMFRPTPLDHEARQRLNLPMKTVRYFSIGEHNPLEPYDESEQPELYVDTELLTQIDHAASSPVSKALQTQLACDFIAGVVLACAGRSEELEDTSWETLQDSLLGRIIGLIAGSGADATQRNQLIADAISNPARFIALAENALGVKKTLIDSFSEGS